MNKWNGFAVGALAGVAMVLLTLLILQNRETAAYAQGTVDNQGGVVMGTGGSQQNFADIVWILSKHPAPRRSGQDPTDIVSSKDERLTLCCYQVGMNGRNIKLVGIRDISFDMDVPEWGNDKPHVKEIIDDLRKAMPKEEKK